MTELLEGIKQDIKKRIDELRPLADELVNLERAYAGMNGNGGTKQKPAKVGAVAKQPRAKASKPATVGATRGRPTGSGATQQRVVDVVKAKPGIKPGDVADELGIARNYLYRLMPGLVEKGILVKADDGTYTATEVEAV